MDEARVVVFIDYQNAYRRARGCFDLEDESHPHGQFQPISLAERIVHKRPGRTLKGVRIYRGLPESSREPKGYGAARRQAHAWKMDDRTTFLSRALRYPVGWPSVKAQEKGVDVALAVDFVVMAVRGEYDVGVLLSSDTDLLPALEGVLALGGDPYPTAEVASWQPDSGHGRRLHVRGTSLWCNWLDRSDFESVKDLRDYNIVTAATGK